MSLPGLAALARLAAGGGFGDEPDAHFLLRRAERVDDALGHVTVQQAAHDLVYGPARSTSFAGDEAS